MWNKLFKSKSKSSKNLSNRSCSGTGLSVADPAAAGGPSSSVAQYEQYGSSVGVAPEPVRMRSRSAVRDPDALDLATSAAASHRDSIGVQMCGIPMRRSKLSSAFKSLSLKRSASKSRLKLAPQGSTGPDGSRPPAVPLLADEYDVLVAGKRASLRPCKSDNNLNEKQQYTEAEKEEPVYIEECKPYEPFEVSSEPPPNLELQPCPICSRKFAPASLAKHIGICERVQAKKRKPFDSSRQRREGTELASYLPKNFGLPQKTVSSSSEAIPVRKLSLSKTPTFERKEFSPTAAMSTSMPSAASTPKPVLKRSMSQQNEPCPYCERCFGMKAYDRHVEWCREKALLSKNAGNNHSISAAKERLQARIQYKAPQIRSKRALNREKYSGSLSCGGSTNSLAELDLHMPRHNSMSSSVSSDNRKPHPSSTSLQQLSLSIGTNVAKEPKANTKREETRKVTKRTKTFTLSSDRLQSDSNNNHKQTNSPSNTNQNGNNGNKHLYHPAASSNRNELSCRTQSKTLLSRSTIDNATAGQRQDKSRPTEQQLKVEKFEIIGHGHSERLTQRPVLTQTVRCTMSNSGYSPDRYDPFLSARRQLEELFSPATSLIHASSPVTTSTSTSRLNQMALSAATNEGHKASNDGASRTSPHNSNFRRAYSLRMPRKVSRPMYVEKAKSNIQKGITDDGPVSPNFLKSSEYDELPIKSTFNALQMAEPKPKLRDSSTVRKNLKLDIKDPNHPAAGAGDLPLSKTDSLAVFLKYETELALSEKDMKDKSNSLSKRTSSLCVETASQQRKQEPLSVNHPPVKKPETPVHELEPTVDRTMPSAEETNVAKKQPQKLIPIKLEPINITYNGNTGTESSATNKPVVISLDAIIGKSSCTKPRDTQYDKENRSDNNYIDPKLINKCDNLPINLLKTTTMDIDLSGSTRTSSSSDTLGNGPLVTEGKQLLIKSVEPEEDRTVPPPPPPRTSKRVFQKPLEQKNNMAKSGDSQISQGDRTQSGSSNASSLASSHSSSPVDNRTTEDSTKGDKRPPLTRQDREDSGYRTGQDSLPDSGEREKQEQTGKPSPKSALKTTSSSANNNYNRPTSSPPSTANESQPLGTIRSPISTGPTTPRSSTNGGEEQRRRPPIVSALEDFDVDEFMQSLDDLHRRSPASAKDFKQSLFGRTQSTVTSRSVSAGQTTIASSKRSNSLDSSNSNTILSTNHHHNERTDQTSSGVPRVDVRVRNGSGTASTHNSSNSSSSISSPSHYSRHFTSNIYNHSNSNNNNNSLHNHSGSKGVTETRTTASPDAAHPLAQRLNHARNSPLVARRRPSEESNIFSLPSVPPSPSGGGLSTNSTVQNLPNIHQTMGDPWRNGNGNTVQPKHHHHQAGNVHVPARSYFSSPSPVNGRNGGYINNNPHHAASHTGTPTSSTSSSHWPASFHDPRFPAESFDHLERDLLKSVQELDRMCGSSSSVCSIDSEELYSVDEYPLDKRSSERSQASADSAYRSSLSTQSPPDYAPPVPLRQGRPSSRSSSTASQKNHQADPPESTFNALPSHTSLPPLTSSTLKGHQVEMYPNKDGMTDSSGPNLILNPMSKFCHECGARFMISSAKFCMSCGVRRIMME
ncbi:probable serine/threonine-protein kinase DDB_G0282963 [Anopheles ziemanni]|uniref:probable serine/threonine-protein kinase DDB_G0282963 n=1 Tax=Anopheles coustani TaxID=139045 RepID=UPI002657D91C|nr:probable serine/threonine-protein kinase DDB_G0282963 [Anopheles coustani]XP_058172866.1 probable serine/threonine-protein kinase DDB_G0282963 [Anopheles ziemanni]